MRKSNVWGRCLLAAVSAVLLMALSGCATLESAFGIAQKGIFMDGPVGGLNYKTPTITGVTKDDGVFRYKPGETVTFSIGEVVLGSAAGKPVVTPLDIVPDAKGAQDQRVVNICVVLQTLDQDGNLENGIQISEKSTSVMSQFGKDIDFNKHVRRFSFDSGFRSVMAELNNIDAFGDFPRAVTPPGRAQKHLEASLAKLAEKK